MVISSDAKLVHAYFSPHQRTKIIGNKSLSYWIKNWESIRGWLSANGFNVRHLIKCARN